MDMSFSFRGTPAESCAALRAMQQQGELCDVIFELDTRERIAAHKCVVSSCSDYFKAMFTSNLAESNQKIIRIREVDFDVMTAVIAFCYSAEFTIHSDKVLPLLIASDLFQIEPVFGASSAFLEKQLQSSTILGLRAHAKLHRCWRLYQLCSDFVFKNFKAISETEEFLSLPGDELEQLIADDQLRVAQEEEIYSAVVRWIYSELEERRKWFTRLMQHVRLPFVSTDFLENEVQSEQLVQEHEECQPLLAEAHLYKSSPEKRGHLKSSPRGRPRKPSGLQEVILVVGGMGTQGTPVSTVEQYDVRTDTWAPLTELPAPSYAMATCFQEGHLYVNGGCTQRCTYNNTMMRFSMRTNEWESLASMQCKRRYHSMVVVFGLLYAIGGQDSEGVLASTEQYNPVDNTWAYVSSLSSARMYHAAVEYSGQLYVAGGHNGIKRLQSVETYDALTDQWSLVAPLSSPRSVMGMAVLGPTIYAVGGFDGVNHLATAESYDPDTNKWSACPPMNISRSAYGLVAYDNCLYACGGFYKNFSSSVERLSPGEDYWLPVAHMLFERVHCAVVST